MAASFQQEAGDATSPADNLRYDYCEQTAATPTCFYKNSSTPLWTLSDFQHTLGGTLNLQT